MRLVRWERSYRAKGWEVKKNQLRQMIQILNSLMLINQCRVKHLNEVNRMKSMMVKKKLLKKIESL